MDDPESILEKDEDRMRCLAAVYELSGGRPKAAFVPHDAVYAKAGVDADAGRAALDYLSASGLVLYRPSHHVSLLRAGADVIEQAAREQAARSGTLRPMRPGLKGNRLAFLRALVKTAEGRTDVGVDPVEVAGEIGIDDDEAGKLENWLKGRGYVEGMTQSHIAITAEAVDAVEELDEQDAAVPAAEERPAMALDPKKVFIIYGRNVKAYEAMRDFLRALGLQPSGFNKMVEEAGGSPYVGDVIKNAMAESQAMVALFTPDERVTLRDIYESPHDKAEDRQRWQARPNVILEAGMALAIDEKRAILATLGTVSLASDVDGRHIMRMSDGIGARNHLKGRLKTAGCHIEESSDYPHAGKFDAAVEGLDYTLGEKAVVGSPPAIAASPAPDMTPEAVRMKLITWLQRQSDERSDVCRGTPIEFSRIDAEAGIPAGAAELHIAKAYGDRWEELERAGGYLILEQGPARVRNVRTPNRFGR
jgi:predicted nucleotide-binding protein